MKNMFPSLTNLAQEIERLETVKKDYIVPTQEMAMIGDSRISFLGGRNESFELNETAHSQLASKLDIPKKYYDKMTEIPDLRSQNVNAWLHNREEKNLVRTLEGKARAFLSDRFKPFDHILALTALFPVLKNMNMEMKSSSLSPSRMYLQIVFPKLEGEVVKGDVVQSGITITNSETGQGSVDISTMIWRLICQNGAVGESLIRKYHVGRKVGDDIEDYDVFRDDTIKAELDSFRLRLRDIFNHAISESNWQNQLLVMKKAAGIEIKKPKETIEEVTRHYKFSETESDLILNNFLTGKNGSVWGLANSITQMAHSVDNPDRQYEYEGIGYDIIQHATEWKDVA